MNMYRRLLEGIPKWLWWLMAIGLFLILALPFLLTLPGFVDFTNTGQIGDTIGGIMGPFIAIVAAFLTFIAFWAQYVANNELVQENRRNHFENRFYKMLDIHLENVDNLNARHPKDSNISCFQLWCDEIWDLYDYLTEWGSFAGFVQMVKNKYKKDPDMEAYVSFLNHLQVPSVEFQRVIFEISYMHFFNKDFLSIDFVDKQQTDFVYRFAEEYFNYLKKRKSFDYNKPEAKNEILGRYYRHLFQIVKYVDKQPDELFDEKNWKVEVLSILRSQMSDYEQMMLYYNAQSSLGRAWDENHFIEKYKLIKNIPLDKIVISAGISPVDRYKEILEEDNEFFEKL